MSVQLLEGRFVDPCRAFDFSDLGDEELRKGHVEGALKSFNKAVEALPVAFSRAVFMVLSCFIIGFQ